jgi:hypothetical protein
MAGFDENLVREYFELNGFLVRQLRKFKTLPRKKQADDDVDLLVYNPGAVEDGAPAGFQLFSADMARIERAVVVVKGWRRSRFSPAMLKSSSRAFDFLKKDVLNNAAAMFDYADDEADTGVADVAALTKILILPALPTSDPQRSESIALLKENGVDGIITFSTILENLFRNVEVNHSYQKSDLLQLMRILKIYDMIREPQMNLFN